MRHWVGIVTSEQFAQERLYARDVIAVPGGPATPERGDHVVLVASAPSATHAVLFAQGTVAAPGGPVLVEYRTRLFDEPPPVPADIVAPSAQPGLFPLPPSQYTRLATLASTSAPGVSAGARDGRGVWFVSVALPIEAATRADAVREFWTYVDKLGPRELPAYVWPLGDELAMQAFVSGAVANLDPEEDED